MPPYFKQETRHTCSLAVLRSVLAAKGVTVSEKELVDKVVPAYGTHFKNLWNPTIAKLACQYGITTHMYAEWPLFKEENLVSALEEFRTNPQAMDISKYESLNDTDSVPEPLPLAYSEMFLAIDLGCKVTYEKLSSENTKRFLKAGNLMQISIRTKKLYPEAKNSYHSILIYDIKGDDVYYHDPARQPSMSCSIVDLVNAANGTGAFMVFA
jgi:hypothetical protein